MSHDGPNATHGPLMDESYPFRAWCPACDHKPEVLCQLHAAAPALLEALQDAECALFYARPCLDTSATTWDRAGMDRAIERVRAAIAQAKGETS